MYLREQLESLEKQTFVQMHLFIRDDGSSEETHKILASELRMPVSINYGSNIGIQASFFELLNQASADVDYYAFCDQDDVWKPDKLSRAAMQLRAAPSNIPVMYCSRTQLVDKSLNHLGYWPPRPRKGASFANAVIENIAVGCTIVINRAARELIIKKTPNYNMIIMHDWWIYLCVSAFGTIIYDSEPTIKYRQHASNSIGGNSGILQKWNRKATSFKKNRKLKLLRKQAQEFYELYREELTMDKRETIEVFLSSNSSFSKRIKYSSNSKLYRQSIIDHYLFRLMYLLNMI